MNIFSVLIIIMRYKQINLLQLKTIIYCVPDTDMPYEAIGIDYQFFK